MCRLGLGDGHLLAEALDEASIADDRARAQGGLRARASRCPRHVEQALVAGRTDLVEPIAEPTKSSSVLQNSRAARSIWSSLPARTSRRRHRPSGRAVRSTSSAASARAAQTTPATLEGRRAREVVSWRVSTRSRAWCRQSPPPPADAFDSRLRVLAASTTCFAGAAPLEVASAPANSTAPPRPCSQGA